MQCTPNALQWCTHNALHPNLNICTRTRNALGLYQIPFNKVKEQCTSNALLRTPTHSMSDILACTANALFNRKGRSKSWLLMPWLLASPGHQQPLYWLCRIDRSLSYSGRIFQLPVLSVWRNDIKCKYMFMFSLKNLACKGLTIGHP